MLSTSLDVIRGSFFFLLILQCVWTVWTSSSVLLRFLEAGVPSELVGVLCVSTALNCVGCLAKVIAFLKLSFTLEYICTYLLIARSMFDVSFWFILVFSFDLHFGLHFYYDTTLLSAVLSALDTVLFPHFLLFEHEKLLRKQE
ncbi:hypothetical protein RB195_005392 [Necator americanus]|uniref:Uncharacterized protein n=1 Tax=Necator americanus TaxID=51031 RepID=A0ABR1BMK7_NECAM